MSITINAVYEDGVFKPLEAISLKEHERVKIDINLDEKLRQRLNQLTESIYKRSEKYTSEEIEKDITDAYKEVRNK